MATLNLDENRSTYQIRAYQPGTIQINELILTESVIVMPDQLQENWPPQTITALTADMLTPIKDLNPDILLLGTGETHHLVSPELYSSLLNVGIGVEVMSTSAACRTFNALASEGRRVAAALIIK